MPLSLQQFRHCAGAFLKPEKGEYFDDEMAIIPGTQPKMIEGIYHEP
ncbi:hypothetical protein EPIR_3245 [Erwinia piriflorinigrans CFBP 5888]|uniref:Uncharacterized protein n=1 Tax=Erwinia piriflorinigrans CFBP 5888 TaxID=1161919 RepID=V5ZB53_9GAMM|nr:hypothetical protein EPIR_3245 [Erwinia piriflorinigrans CFBP 5888]